MIIIKNIRTDKERVLKPGDEIALALDRSNEDGRGYYEYKLEIGIKDSDTLDVKQYQRVSYGERGDLSQEKGELVKTYNDIKKDNINELMSTLVGEYDLLSNRDNGDSVSLFWKENTSRK